MSDNRRRKTENTVRSTERRRVTTAEKTEVKADDVVEAPEEKTIEAQEEHSNEENSLVETKVKSSKKSFTVIEVTNENAKPKRNVRTKQKKEGEIPAVNN